MTIAGQPLYNIIVVFLFGICIGSFLNVCIYRIPEKKSIVSPGSFCPICGRAIPFYLNIPVISYLILLGRCRFCRTAISIRYPLVEFLTGLMAVFLLLKFGLTAVFGYWFVFVCVLVVISFIDLDHQIIPDIISKPGIIIFASSYFFLPEMTLKDILLGILIGGGILWAVGQLYYLAKKKEGMGGGDIKLMAMIGAAAGVKGVLFTIFAGSLIGTVIGGIMMLISLKFDSELKIPFGPFLSLGIGIYIFYGEAIIYWYFKFLTP